MRTYDAWFPRYALGNGLMFFCRVFSPAVGRGSSALSTFLDRHTQRVKPSQGKTAQVQISSLATSRIKGYLLEVDVRYPTELHDSHNDLPFLCDKMKINKVKKLVPNLRDKQNYIIHIRALDQALRHELVLERIHRAIELNQTDWMKPYI